MKKRNGSNKVASLTQADISKDMWINPKSNLRGTDGNRAWDHRTVGDPTNGARFLELADLALGLKKSDSRKKKAAAAGAGVHQTSEKTEPYSRSNN